MAERREFEVAVVGLGGIGSGAVYWAAKRVGGGVLGLERFEFGHERGASQDHSRIIRLSYHTPEYVRFARDSYAAWSDARGGLRRAARDPDGRPRPLSRERARVDRRLHERRSTRSAGSRTSGSTPARRCGAGRSGGSPTTSGSCTRRTPGSWRPRRRTTRTGAWPRAMGATLVDDARVDGGARGGRAVRARAPRRARSAPSG